MPARSRLAALPLFWRVFVANAFVLAVAVALLALLPVTVSIPVAATEVVLLLVGMVAMLTLDLVLLRQAFRPLQALTTAMRRIDPLAPGRRVEVVGEPELATLAETFNEMLDRLEDERRESARRALRVQEGERQRVARELHDEVGQTLTAMMLQIESLGAKIPPELTGELDELREATRAGAEDVRRIAVRLRPEALDELGLHSALSSLATAFGEHAGVRINKRIERVSPLTQEQELVVYRVAQEALTNVARHAEAAVADLSLGRTNGTVTLRVRDDGRGIAPEQTRSTAGIRGMRERAMLIGADLAIAAPREGGTEIVLRVPAGPA